MGDIGKYLVVRRATLVSLKTKCLIADATLIYSMKTQIYEITKNLAQFTKLNIGQIDFFSRLRQIS